MINSTHPLFYFFFGVLLISSCNNDDLKNRADQFELSEKRLRVPLPKQSLLRTFHRKAQYCKLNGKSFYWGYSQFDSVLEWFRLDDGAEFGRIRLPQSGPLPISRVESFYVHNLDSIFILGTKDLVMIDTSGTIKWNLPINFKIDKDTLGMDFDKFMLYNTPKNRSPMFYDEESQNIYMAIKPSTGEKIYDLQGCPLAARYNLDSGQFEVLPIRSPAAFYQYYTPLDKPNITFEKGRVLYNFPYSNQLFIYNLENDNLDVKSLESEFLPGSAIPLDRRSMEDRERMMRYICENVDYYRVQFDPQTKLYYRLAIAPDEGGRHRGKLVLSAYNELFELVAEEKLISYSPFGPNAMTPEGLMLVKNPSYLVEDTLKLSVFSYQ